VLAPHSALPVRIQTIPSSLSDRYQDSRRLTEHCLHYHVATKFPLFAQIESPLIDNRETP